GRFKLDTTANGNVNGNPDAQVTVGGNTVCSLSQWCSTETPGKAPSSGDAVDLGFGTYPKPAVIIVGVICGLFVLAAGWLLYRQRYPAKSGSSSSGEDSSGGPGARTPPPSGLLRRILNRQHRQNGGAAGSTCVTPGSLLSKHLSRAGNGGAVEPERDGAEADGGDGTRVAKGPPARTSRRAWIARPAAAPHVDADPKSSADAAAAAAGRASPRGQTSSAGQAPSPDRLKAAAAPTSPQNGRDDGGAPPGGYAEHGKTSYGPGWKPPLDSPHAAALDPLRRRQRSPSTAREGAGRPDNGIQPALASPRLRSPSESAPPTRGVGVDDEVVPGTKTAARKPSVWEAVPADEFSATAPAKPETDEEENLPLNVYLPGGPPAEEGPSASADPEADGPPTSSSRPRRAVSNGPGGGGGSGGDSGSVRGDSRTPPGEYPRTQGPGPRRGRAGDEDGDDGCGERLLPLQSDPRAGRVGSPAAEPPAAAQAPSPSPSPGGRPAHPDAVARGSGPRWSPSTRKGGRLPKTSKGDGGGGGGSFAAGPAPLIASIPPSDRDKLAAAGPASGGLLGTLPKSAADRKLDATAAAPAGQPRTPRTKSDRGGRAR
ncbi:MAG: hypothetical protein BJ554DRAFT_2699, partial [Olpidium bornovanus]